VRSLLKRCEALSIRSIDFEIHRHYGHDPWLRRWADDLLRPMRRDYAHGLVLFDHEGCGDEATPPEEIEQAMEDGLRRSGWQRDAARVVVVHPELEAWLLGRRRRAAQILGVSEQDLGQTLAKFELSPSGRLVHPKEALADILKTLLSKRPKSATVFAEFARSMGRLDECQDRAFAKFRDTLRRWFPEGSAGST